MLYRHPKSRLNTYRNFGGYLAYRQMISGRSKMASAAFGLQAVESSADGKKIYFLTGKKYLFQTLFCIQSLARVSKVKFSFTLVDDGTFDEAIIKQISRQLPGAEIITASAIKNNLDTYLPENLYPNLHQKRKIYPHIKKLTDIHTIAPSSGWKLTLDSDMLFWNSPDEIIKWLQAPQSPLHMVDCVESYGYSRQLMESISNHKIPGLLNVGAIGLNSSKINWRHIEDWIQQLEQREGASYYLEQAITAMLIGPEKCVVLNAETYQVNPPSLNMQVAILHHYVDTSKKIYFNQAWKQLIKK